jgi:hypothetical protein
MNDVNEMIMAMSHGHFNFIKATPVSIKEFIDRMKIAFPDGCIDEEWLFRKIEATHFVTVGDAHYLDDFRDHVDWFNASTNMPLEGEIRWHYWDHYKTYLQTQKGWSPSVVKSIDDLSSQILSRLEDPRREGPWDRRGMVMGSVQSGKTANYTGLITKASDAGYKIIIVMAGVHNSLRSQTQSRLNEEFLGYAIGKVQQVTGYEKPIGVRSIFPDHRSPSSLTSSMENGDFNRKVASQVGIVPNVEGQPLLLVIKKNVSILRNLYGWLTGIICQRNLKGEFYIKDIPLLMIDDECDFASINTKVPEKDEEGKIIDDWDPTAINRGIRRILKLFGKSAYVGYTATPYANIFIHIDDTHGRYGDDLFPRSFIISLPPPSNYMSPEKLFGLNPDAQRGIDGLDPLPLIREVTDNGELIPEVHRKELIVKDLPLSMKEALKTFIISCSVRGIRKDGTPHNSMLIHVTRFTMVQHQIHELVEDELRKMIARMMSGDRMDDFREVWERDFLPTTRTMAGLGYRDSIEHEWDAVRKNLFRVSKNIKIKLINGTAKDVLDYRDHDMLVGERIRNGENVNWEMKGISVIAIGGDKLSRGLTLEGLSVSYYLRFTNMYDTLMQMGRWFGFREGYSDLCRIYTTDELASWYRYIAGATKELREEIEYMSDLGETPETFGLKVKSHPGRLVVTSANKSRNKEKIQLSYAGNMAETVVFDPRNSAGNLRAVEKLIHSIGRDCDERIDTRKPRLRWNDVESEIVLDFLHGYRTQDQAKRVVDPEIIARYIQQQNKNGELTRWCVVIVSNLDATRVINVSGYEIGLVQRTPISISDEKISIRRLVSPNDEMIDLTETEIKEARRHDDEVRNIKTGDKPSNRAIRHSRPKERGLMLVYIAHSEGKGDRSYGEQYPVGGFAISFPESETAVPVEYWVNPIYLDEEKRFT